jgi:hypothetical protein
MEVSKTGRNYQWQMGNSITLHDANAMRWTPGRKFSSSYRPVLLIPSKPVLSTVEAGGWPSVDSTSLPSSEVEGINTKGGL